MNQFAIFILLILHQVLDSVNFPQLRNLGPGKFGQSYLWKFLLLIILSIAPISEPGQMPSNEIHKHLRLHRFQVGHEMITNFDSTTSSHIQVAHGSPRLPTSQTSGAGGLQDFQKKLKAGADIKSRAPLDFFSSMPSFRSGRILELPVFGSW